MDVKAKVRKNIRSLTNEEKRRFVKACLQLKKEGRYDEYVHQHHHVMIPTVLPHEPRHPNYRNGAHRGPSFLPWHRAFLIQFETDLQRLYPDLTVPYWDWTQDVAAPRDSPVWADDFMGGDGVEADQWRVATGPFAEKEGNWPVPGYPEDGLPGTGLKRQFGVVIDSVPTPADLAMAMNERLYDTPPYNSSPFTTGFRNRLEGWITQRGDCKNVEKPGSQLHNRVHLWIGGNMLPMTSPDDPVFFLHHCYIDKVWADWQQLRAGDDSAWSPHYAPLEAGPPGHNFDDVLKPWTHKISDMMNIADLGYSYEQSVDKPKPTSPFRKSPFME
ncbi:tyrosinase [Pseudomonas sp. S3E12]|nr:tyrosinase [Pseudomonas sp. S3E12]